MKYLILSAVLALSPVAFASDYDTDALTALMTENPLAAGNGADRKVNELIASIVTSSFDENGSGALSVTTNSCEETSPKGTYACTLNILNSDREIKDDSYVPKEDMTESSLTIWYMFDSKTGKIKGKPDFMQAG